MLTVEATMASFMAEIKAFKPGNISIYSDGHDMTVADFIISAAITTPLLCQTDNSIGERILSSVISTQRSVHCNTNLGMLLLFAPIIVASESSQHNTTQTLRHQIKRVLESSTIEDTRKIYRAIRIAKPGGLGHVTDQDVSIEPDCSLIQSMQLAAHYDSIAWQYSNHFETIFELGVLTLHKFMRRWHQLEWATTACYLTFLSSITDSHIQRKHGQSIANKIRVASQTLMRAYMRCERPEKIWDLLCAFDQQLKARRYNPGTSADMTAASLLIYHLTEQ